MAVYPERMAGQSTDAQGEEVNASEEPLQPLDVPLPLPCVAQEPVRPADRLSSLEVGVAGQQQVHLLLCALSGDADEVLHVGDQRSHLLPQPQPNVRYHLVVPAPSCVQLAPHGADDFRQPSLVCRVDIFVPSLHLELPALPFLPDSPQPLLQLLHLVIFQDPSPPQRSSVRDAALQVLLPHALVIGEGSIESLHERVGLS
mmetsp:Transcript_30802/g.99057  ORF Transcript_30802/g.99057 Transcript_30802/m.99057 type:complete len:201 (-) Transcript_30802:231-833(-)